MREIDLNQPVTKSPRHTFLCHGDTRCISGDAFIGYQVRTPEGELQNCKGGTLAHLYRRFNKIKTPGKGYNQRKQTINSAFWAPSMTEDGRVFQNKITAVIDSGVKPCVRVRTVGGLELVCTADHPIAEATTQWGFTHAGELKAGDEILVHNHTPWSSDKAKEPRVNRPELYVKHHPHAPTKIVRVSSGSYEYKRLARARAVYEAHMNGLTLEAFTARLNDGRLNGLKFLSKDIDIHHKDEDKLNDVPENLEALSHAEHSREHFVLPNGRPRSGSYIAVTDVVSSVTSAGEHQTYDIKMTAPNHNFVADGFIVHNSGKTTFAATFPRPLFLADATESGWDSIKNIDPTMLFEPNVIPRVWTMEAMNDFDSALTKAEPLIASGEVLTLVVDSITFYADMYLNYILNLQTKKDNREAYGNLGQHLRNVRVRVQGKFVNVVWLALTSHPNDDHPVGVPMIPGQQAAKFAAGVDFIMYARATHDKNGSTFEMRTRKYGAYVAGNRLGINNIGDPFVGTYTDLMLDLGYDVAAMKAALKPYKRTVINVNAAPAVIAPPAKPVVVATRPAVVAPPPRKIIAPVRPVQKA